ncbi:TIGR01777 family oxidoreductase [Metabacillus sp. GX 13764]|uniref:TIGR01777 family oxidoreductase n=1 Tax=Metabacillus kandeliae TaxID=2900151 RepID=UPI001E5EDFE7|nr:TIGR01777 family oxidoreductase [Metabacillus kandeliae]MCD7036375.1 TIGR01777 family oxidoreductase [Metabacillus kandeliae]
MKVAIAGGSGFIGKQLSQLLENEGHHVFILTRSSRQGNGNITYVQWMKQGSHPELALEGIDAFVNLAGKSINSRWTEENKQKILESRIQATSEAYRILEALRDKPSVVVNASAVGIYGTSEESTFTEESPPRSSDLLAKTASIWEEEAAKIEAELGIRTVFARFGIILGEEGALPLMALPYKLFAGGKIGSGTQWISWVHINDAARLLLYCIRNESIRGPINITAPNPVQNDTFGRTIANVLHKPHWLRAPAFAIKSALGDMSMMVLEGQRAIPKKALEQQFHYSFPALEEALQDILKSN